MIEKVLLYSNNLGFKICEVDYSPIKGPAGNIEYIAFMKKQNKKQNIDLFIIREQIKKVVEESHKELNKSSKSINK